MHSISTQEARIQSTLRGYSFEKSTGRLWVPQRSSSHSIYPRSPISRPYDILSLPPLVILCQNLHTLDYKHRNSLLECARAQKRIGSNQHLSREFSTLLSSAYRIYLSPRTFQALIQQEFLPRSYCVGYIVSRKFCSLFDNLYDDPLGCSLLSYLTRVETTDHLETLSEQLDIDTFRCTAIVCWCYWTFLRTSVRTFII